VSDEDRQQIPVMKEAVYEYELVRRRVADPIIDGKAGPEKLAQWVQRTFAGITDQRLLVFAIDADTRVLGYAVLQSGSATVESVMSDAEIMRTIIQLGMRRFALVQITPGFERVELTDNDKEFCVHVGDSASQLGLDFLDMIIVGEKDWMSARATAHDLRVDSMRREVGEAYGIADDDMRLIEDNKEAVLRAVIEALGEDPALLDSVHDGASAERLMDRLMERARSDPKLARQAAEAAEQAIRDQIRRVKDGDVNDDSAYLSLEDLMGGETTDLEDGWGPAINDTPA
jgi:RadC-like JAB domain-containing protein